jgi:hypothetical protein
MRKAILPGRAERGGPVPDPHRSHASLERDAKCPVIVADEIFRCAVPRECFSDLTCQPLRRRISSRRKPQQLPPSMAAWEGRALHARDRAVRRHCRASSSWRASLSICADLVFGSDRLIGSIRRHCLDHVIVFGEQHLRHLLKSYQKYYNEARTHLSLQKDAPIPRAVQTIGQTLAVPILGGLHPGFRQPAPCGGSDARNVLPPELSA